MRYSTNLHFSGISAQYAPLIWCRPRCLCNERDNRRSCVDMDNDVCGIFITLNPSLQELSHYIYVQFNFIVSLSIDKCFVVLKNFLFDCRWFVHSSNFIVRPSKQPQMKMQSKTVTSHNKSPLSKTYIAFIHPPQCFALFFHFHAACC